jgi:hypothetical protein
MNRFPLFLWFCVLIVTLPVSADVTITYGDIDGFGFTNVAALIDEQGNPADKNMNGILDAGDTLPSLGNTPGIGIAPGSDDFFDNRTPADPALTDVGLSVNTLLPVDFSFAIPERHVVYSATITIVAGDLSLDHAPSHGVLVDGQSTGQILVPRQVDGEITVSSIQINESMLDAFLDGSVTVTLAFDAAPDDIAIDYIILQVDTKPDVIPLSFLPLLLD